VFFGSKERAFLRWWTAMWAVACAVATLFTVLTFLIDMPRFAYPVRPIFFMALSYFVIAIVYIVGFVHEHRLSCVDSPHGPNAPKLVAQVQCVFPVHIVTLLQGTGSVTCTALAVLHYFFNIASAIWWVILCLTWFLAANLKWAQESIERHAHFFHLFAWGAPALLMMWALIMHKVCA
jgi:hypothetical protein